MWNIRRVTAFRCQCHIICRVFNITELTAYFKHNSRNNFDVKLQLFLRFYGYNYYVGIIALPYHSSSPLFP